MYASALPTCKQSIFVEQILIICIKKRLQQKISVQFPWLESFHKKFSDVNTDDEDLILSVNSQSMVITKSPLLLSTVLEFLSLFLFVGAVLLLISTWFYSNQRGNFKFSKKAKTRLKHLFFKMGVVIHFNDDQTAAKQIKVI